jgi:hypothetical protein
MWGEVFPVFCSVNSNGRVMMPCGVQTRYAAKS